MSEVLRIDESQTLNLMLRRIANSEFTYGKRLLMLIKENGYINTHITLSKNNKKTSIEKIKNIDMKKCEKYKKYFSIALAGK